MMRYTITVAVGLLFGCGLLLSGMANPDKVLGFLDLTGQWDPSLAMVMLGAVSMASVGFAWAKRHAVAMLGEAMQLPKTTVIDKPLIIGSLLFGTGWGLAGFCPGTAWVATVAGNGDAALFFLAMLVGMRLFRWFDTTRTTH